MNHWTVFSDKIKYASFPSLAIGNGIVYCAFRLAPTKRSKTHIDTRSIAVLVSSRDQGETWDVESEISFPASDQIGIQDPSLTILSNKNFLLTCYGWSSRKKERHTKKLKHARMEPVCTFISKDLGKSWEGPTYLNWQKTILPVATSEPIVESDGFLYLAGYGDLGGGGHASVLYVAEFKESFMPSWNRFSKIAHDGTGKLNFQEPAILSLGDGHLLCLMRVPTKNATSIYQAHSWDYGDTWEPPRDTGIRGLPPNLLQLADGRILCTYGYRKSPYAIKSCISYDNGLSWDTKNEITLRAGAGGWDIGYPSTVQLPDNSLLTAYYWFTKKDKTRRIEVTRWKLKG